VLAVNNQKHRTWLTWCIRPWTCGEFILWIYSMGERVKRHEGGGVRKNQRHWV